MIRTDERRVLLGRSFVGDVAVERVGRHHLAVVVDRDVVILAVDQLLAGVARVLGRRREPAVECVGALGTRIVPRLKIALDLLR